MPDPLHITPDRLLEVADLVLAIIARDGAYDVEMVHTHTDPQMKFELGQALGFLYRMGMLESPRPQS